MELHGPQPIPLPHALEVDPAVPSSPNSSLTLLHLPSTRSNAQKSINLYKNTRIRSEKPEIKSTIYTHI
jgi:hypothetical protein